MKKKTLLTSAVVAGTLLFILASIGYGQEGRWFHRSPEKKAAHMVERISDELDLNESQKSALVKIKDEILEKRKQRAGDRQELMDAVIEESKREEFNQANIQGILDNKKPDYEKMADFLLEKYVEFHKILTPEQRTKLAAKLEKLKERHSRY